MPRRLPHILWLARTLPVPLDAGDRMYSGRLAEAIGRAGARIDFLGPRNPDAPDAGTELFEPVIDWRVVPGGVNAAWRALLSREPFVGGRFGTRPYRATIRDAVRAGDYDAILFDHCGTAWALPLVAAARGPGGRAPTLIHIAHNFEGALAVDIARDFKGRAPRKLALWINAVKTKAAERRLARRCDAVIALTEGDAAAFRAIDPAIRTLIVPPGYSGPRVNDRRLSPATPRRVAIVGSYRWIPKQMNLSAFLEIADPLFARAGIELAVIGDGPAEFRAAWEPRLRATRFVHYVDDLAATLDACRMGLVVEATGGGFKLKVLDYVFTRTPVAALAPSLGGQPAAMVRHFLVRDDAAALAEAVIGAIDDLDRLNAMQDGAYAAAATSFSWDANAARVLGLIADLGAKH